MLKAAFEMPVSTKDLFLRRLLSANCQTEKESNGKKENIDLRELLFSGLCKMVGFTL